LITGLFLTFAVTVRAADAKSDVERIQGTWGVVYVESDGNPAPEELRTLRFVFDGEKLWMDNTAAGGQSQKTELTFKLDQTKKPNALDYSPLDGPGKGQVAACIYELNGDTLKLVVRTGKKDIEKRPTEFKTAPGSYSALFELKRLK